jgi:protein-tyrosine phosphatase
MMNNIMIVCVGNICRSPVAEGLLKNRLPGRKVWSAGLHAVVGHGAEPNAREIAKRHGLDLSVHLAQQVAGWMCSLTDLVLVMEASHQLELEKRYPTACGKIHRLGKFSLQGNSDIADPYRQSRAAFEVAHAAIARGVDEWVRRIKLVS